VNHQCGLVILSPIETKEDLMIEPSMLDQ